MGLWGADIIRARSFLGVSFDQDPSGLPESLASSLLNADPEATILRKRLGYDSYNSAAPTAARVNGLAAYYPSAGARSIVMQAGASVYADTNQDGDFDDAGEEIASGLTAGVPMDMIQSRDTLFLLNSVDQPRKWTGSGASSIITPLAAPTGVTLSLDQTIAETFDNSGALVAVNQNPAAPTISATYETTTPAPYEGTHYVQLEATAEGAEGDYVYKGWGSASGALDLEKMESLEIWARCNLADVAFKFAIFASDQTMGTDHPDWKSWATHRFTTAKAWERFIVPLDPIPRSKRNAANKSKGWAIRYVGDGGNGYGTSIKIKVDACSAHCGMTPGIYRYFATFATVDLQTGAVTAESEPTAEATLDTSEQSVWKGVLITVTGAPPSGANRVRIYRHLKDGPFSRPQLIASLDTASVSYPVTDSKDDGDLAIEISEGLSVPLVFERDPPPKAQTYAVVGRRLLAGGVTLGSTYYPQRVYESRADALEQFADLTDPDDPDSAWWYDLGAGERIVRIIPYERMALIFCERSIWTREGDNIGDFRVTRRASVGLDARWAVAEIDSLVFFLSQDGVRVIAPRLTETGEFDTWIISEPVDSKLRAIPANYRQNACMAIDERSRMILCYTPYGGAKNAECLVFDPRLGGASGRWNPRRPGWTHYTGTPFALLHRLRRGGGDFSQLLAGDTENARVWRLFRDAANAPIETDAGSPIGWHYQTPASQIGAAQSLSIGHVELMTDAQAQESLTVEVYNERDDVVGHAEVSLGPALTGGADPPPVRFGARARGRAVRVRVSGTHSTAMALRECSMGVYRR